MIKTLAGIAAKIRAAAGFLHYVFHDFRPADRQEGRVKINLLVPPLGIEPRSAV